MKKNHDTDEPCKCRICNHRCSKKCQLENHIESLYNIEKSENAQFAINWFKTFTNHIFEVIKLQTVDLVSTVFLINAIKKSMKKINCEYCDTTEKWFMKSISLANVKFVTIDVL